jgi:hypothetical protein
MEIKKFVKEHKKDIAIATLAVGGCVLAYVVLKDKQQIKRLKEQVDFHLELAKLQNGIDGLVVEQIKETNDNMETIKAAMSEGMVQEAIATTTRKLNNRMDIIARLTNVKGELDFDNKMKLQKAIEEAEVFKKRLAAFNKVVEDFFIQE